MGLYTKYVLPRIIHLGCGVGPAHEQRARIVPRAKGTVLDLGIGSGHTLRHYDSARVERILGVDPSAELRAMAVRTARETDLDIVLLGGFAESLPIADATVATAVATYTVCSVADPAAALREVRRVLRPGGMLLFCEHGASPDQGVRRWQDRMTPLWRRLGGGCHLNREMARLIEAAGFRIEELETTYLPGWKPATYTYRGWAIPS